MKGAHCVICKEHGPDLVVGTDAYSDPVPDGMVADIEFTCGGCGRRWTWRAHYIEGAWRYVVILPAPTRPGWTPAN